jgi:amino acid adenylation domain-containing protein
MAFLLHQLLSESAAKYPHKKAVIFQDQSITYFELDKNSNRLANILIEHGIRRGNKVGIYMSRSINSIIALFGVLKAGAAYVPIDHLCPGNRLKYIIDKCQIEFLISSQEKLTNIEKSFPERLPFKTILMMNDFNTEEKISGSVNLLAWGKLQVNANPNKPDVNVIDTDLSYILFTSGSTGNPKGVMISHLNSLTFVNMASDFFQSTENDIFSNNSPLHFDLSIFDFFVAIKTGASVSIVPESVSMFPAKLAEFIEKNKITVWNSVPSALSLLATYTDLSRFDLSKLRLVLFAGEVFPVKYLKQLMKNTPSAQFYNVYGQTEANSSMYYLIDKIPEDDSCLIPIGKPFPDFDVFALNENNKKVIGPGQKGELYVRASSVAFGYLGDTEKTNEKFVKNPLKLDSNEKVYRTGDIVSLDANGNYIFLGRVDHMIKSRGYRIEIGEIETLLANHPQVKNSVVVPIPDDLIGNRIAAIIVPLNNNSLKKEDILRYCAKQLPKYMIPEIIVFSDRLPETSSGKTDRKKLAEQIKLCHFSI